MLLSSQLDDHFPFLKKAIYIFICEQDEDSSAYQSLKCNEHIDIHLQDPRVDHMEEILLEMAPTLKLSRYDQVKLFHLSGGRLSIIALLAQYLAENKQLVLEGTPLEVVSLVLGDRLEHMGNKGNELKSVLETAAAIGIDFHIPILKLAVTCSLLFENLLQKAQQEFLIEYNKDMGKFLYRDIWNYFCASNSKEHLTDISMSIAKAVYFFNPYDYLTRAFHLECAGEIAEACELYLLAYNSVFQEGLQPPGELVEKIGQVSQLCGMNGYWNTLQKFYADIKKLHFKQGLRQLEEMSPTWSMRLLLLKEYLLGLYMYKTANTQDELQDSILAIEEAAKHAQNFEDGIWCDCQMIRISFCVNCGGNIMQAREISKELSYYYTQKSFAPFAKKGLHALQRKHSALYSVERAVVKTKNSVDFFRTSTYPSQYLMALNNHAANLMVIGHLSEAMKFLREAYEFIASYKHINVNRMYILNNYCLCSVLLDLCTAEEAYKAVKPVLHGKSLENWAFILELNCAIYRALQNDLSGSEGDLLRLIEIGKQLSDDYYSYYAYANLASVYFLQQKTEKALDLLDTKCLLPPALFKETEKYYLTKRTEQWKQIMASESITNPKVFDQYLLAHHPPNTQWSFIGRGFLYSDIQFWSEP